MGISGRKWSGLEVRGDSRAWVPWTRQRPAACWPNWLPANGSRTRAGLPQCFLRWRWPGAEPRPTRTGSGTARGFGRRATRIGRMGEPVSRTAGSRPPASRPPWSRRPTRRVGSGCRSPCWPCRRGTIFAAWRSRRPRAVGEKRRIWEGGKRDGSGRRGIRDCRGRCRGGTRSIRCHRRR